MIVNTASIAAYDGQIGQVAYAANKAAIVGMTLPIARDLSSLGNVASLPSRRASGTPLLASSKVQDELAATVPNPRRLGDPDEFAHLVSIIENRMMNGGSTPRRRVAYGALSGISLGHNTHTVGSS